MAAMTDRIYPPDWHFADRPSPSEIQNGDRFPAVLDSAFLGKDVCQNCGTSEGLLYSHFVAATGPMHSFGNRFMHAQLHSAPCPVCRGDALQTWLADNCGLAGLELDNKPALDIRVSDEQPVKGQEAAFKLAFELMAELPEAKTWALFSGDYGRGKTHILCGLVNAARLAGVWSVYTTSEKILARLRETYDPASAIESTAVVRRRFENIPVLVVDELDRVKWTHWAGEQLVAILNERYMHGRATWFASNMGPTALAKEVEPLAALVSRISSGQMVGIAGDDLRPMEQDEMPLPDYLVD
jgi:DNA replication protein DnaC